MQRNSILNERHRQLGSKLDGDTWNNMPIPWSYNTDRARRGGGHPHSRRPVRRLAR